MTNFTDELGRALKYLTEKREDFYPSLVGEETTPHLMLADFLRENGEPELADRVHQQATLHQQGVRPRPAHLGDSHSLHDFVLHAVRTGHPNPTVRAFAAHAEEAHDPQPLLDLLFHYSPESHPYNHDAAVWLSPQDAAATHSAHDVVKRLSARPLFEQGLEPKVVRGEVYLLDHDDPDPRAFGAPRIVYTSPVNDRDDLKAMVAHAEQLAGERVAMGGAHVGPAH